MFPAEVLPMSEEIKKPAEPANIPDIQSDELPAQELDKVTGGSDSGSQYQQVILGLRKSAGGNTGGDV